MPIRPENRDRYPADWKARSRFVRQYRARNRCEWCGVQNGSFLKPRCCQEPIWDERGVCLSCGQRIPRVVLTVAHVFDDRPEASDLLNLAALCQRCHNRHDAKARRARRRERLERESGQLTLFASKSYAHLTGPNGPGGSHD
jgi:5-methylcytosine-specific restriction endonuclease McrA